MPAREQQVCLRSNLCAVRRCTFNLRRDPADSDLLRSQRAQYRECCDGQSGLQLGFNFKQVLYSS